MPRSVSHFSSKVLKFLGTQRHGLCSITSTMQLAHVYRFALIFGITLFFAVGCEKTGVKQYPSTGKTNVPANAAIQIQYTGKEFIRNADITPSKFQLKICEDDEISGPIEEDEVVEDVSDEDEAEKPERGQAQNSDRIRGLLERRTFEVDRKYEDGTTERFKRTDIVFIPVSQSYEHPPLPLGETLCFDASEVRGEGGKVHAAVQFSFSVEEESSFSFGESASIMQWVYPKEEAEEVHPESTLLFEFDRPVHPSDLKGTVVCQKERYFGQFSGTGLCKGIGREVSTSAVLVEPLMERDGNLLINYTTYGLKLGGNLPPGRTYVAKVGLGVSGEHVHDARLREFRIAEPTPELKKPNTQNLMRETLDEETRKQDVGFSFIPLERQKR